MVIFKRAVQRMIERIDAPFVVHFLHLACAGCVFGGFQQYAY